MDIQFDHTIVKVNKDGHVVMGNSLSKGEKLISGETYAEVQERLGGETVGIPAAQEVVTVEAQPLTLDASQTSTVPADETVPVEITSTPAPENTEQEKNDDAPVLGADSQEGGELKGTLDEAGDSTAVVPVEDGDTPEDEGDGEEKDDDQTGVRPDDNDPKPVWFEYALGKGHKGEYDDITKKQLIEQYGD